MKEVNKKIKIRIRIAHKYDIENHIFDLKISIPIILNTRVLLVWLKQKATFAFDIIGGLDISGRTALIWARRSFIFLSILAIVFSPLSELAKLYLPEKIAEVIPETKTTQAHGDDVSVFLHVSDNTPMSNLWTVPDDWNNASNSIEVIGGGGTGGDGTDGSNGAAGGGGGAYSRSINITLTPGGSAYFSVGASGSSPAANMGRGGDGGHTWFSTDTSDTSLALCNAGGTSVCVSAEGGAGGQGGGAADVPGGLGGATASGSANTSDMFAGGNGGIGQTEDSHGGGGGSGGPAGAGKNGGTGGTTASDGGGGGGGAGGGLSTAGTAGSGATGGDGGNGYNGGAGGQNSGGNGVNVGSGGGAGDNAAVGGNGANGGEFGSLSSSSGGGSGGGGGGAGDGGDWGGRGGNFGGGGGGGDCATAAQATRGRCRGGDGVIHIRYTPLLTVTQRAYVFQNDSAVNGNPNSNNNTTTAVNTALTNVKIGQKFIARFQLDSGSTLTNQNFKVQYDKGSDGNWRELGVASAAFFPAPIMSFGDVATRSLTSAAAGSCNGGETYANGEIINNSNFANTISFTSSQCTELAFAIRTASVSLNTTYRFRLFNWAASTGMTFSQYPTVTTVTSANDTIRYSKFLVGPPATASQSSGFLAASRSYSFSVPLEEVGYASVSTNNSKFEFLASISAYTNGGSIASASNLFFQDGRGLYKTASESINTIGWNGTYWVVGMDRAKLVKISQNRDNASFTDVSANLASWTSTAAVRAIHWNGIYWLLGGVGELNRCNFDITSCTDVSGNLTGFGVGNTINTIQWNGTYWLIGGNRGASTEGLNRCNDDITICTNVASNLTDWATTDAILSVHWGNSRWFIGGANAQANTCVSDVGSACTDVDTNLTGAGFGGTDSVLSAYWNGTYWLITGQNANVTRCTAAISCIDVSANLASWGASNHASASYWNGSYWLLGGSGQELNRCNVDLTSCMDASAKLINFNSSGGGAIMWDGTAWLIGGESGRINHCTSDMAACENFYESVKNFNSNNITTVSAGSNHVLKRWLIGGAGADANRCSEGLASCSFVTLSNFSTDKASSSYFANGQFAIVGGTSNSRLNSCPLTGSCTDRSSNLTATTNALNVVHGGDFWLVGGANRFINRCPLAWGACTSVAAQLTAGWVSTDSIKAILWTGSRWFIGGGTNDDLNVCTGSDVSSCTAVTLSGFGVQVRALAKNFAYILVGGTGGELNRCTLAGASCTDVAANLSGFSSNNINTIQWIESVWLIAGAGGKINVCNYDVTDCRDISSNTLNSIGTNNINAIGWSGKLAVVVADSAKIVPVYPRFPAYHMMAKNSSNTDKITFTWNGKTSIQTASRSFNVEVFNHASNSWEPASVSFSIPANTEATVTAEMTSSAPAGWWNTSWGTRKKIYIKNDFLNNNLYNFPIIASLSASNIDFSKTLSSGADLRFVDENGSLLDHEIEGTWTESGNNVVWVRVPMIPARGTTKYIWMYYNNSGASDGQNATGVWDSEYRGVWHLSNLNDSTSGGRNLTNSNAQSTTGGRIGSAYDFERDSSAYAYVASLPTAATDNWSLEAWVKPETSSLTGNIVVNGAEPTGGWGLVQGDNSCAAGIEITPVFSGVACIDSDVNFTGAGSWDHVVITRANAIEHIYKNGINSGFADAGVSPSTPVSNLSLGMTLNTSQVPQGSNYHDGVIDEVRISDTKRSAEWIGAEYNYTLPLYYRYGKEENLAAYSLANYSSQSFGGSDYWTHWRFYQNAGFETLSTDYINFAFTAPAEAPVTDFRPVGYQGSGGISVGGESGGGQAQGGGGPGGGSGGSGPGGGSGGGGGQSGGGAGGGGGGSPVIFYWWWLE